MSYRPASGRRLFDLGNGQRIALTDRGIRLPHTLGHENVGEVVACGPAVSDVAVGDRVLVYPWIGCDACERCTSGEGHLCDAPRFVGVFRAGGFGDEILVPDAKYVFPIGELSPTQAAPLACSGLTTFAALDKVRDVLDRGPVVVLGAGGLGLMALALLRLMEARGAYVIEPDAAKRAAAIEQGALDAFDDRDADMERLASSIGGGVHAVIDLVGTPASIRRGIGLLRKGGRLVVVGMFGGAMDVAIPLVVLRSLAIEGSYVGSLSQMGELMALVRRNGMPTLPITSRPLAEINQAFDALRSGAVVGRTVLHP